MRRLIITFLLLASTLVTAWGQEALIGTWENGEAQDLTVVQFRDDGIMIQNEYYSGVLSCVYVSIPIALTATRLP